MSRARTARRRQPIAGDGVALYLEPYIARGVASSEMNMPAAGPHEEKPRAPFVARTVVAARGVRLGTEHERLWSPIGCFEDDVQRTSTCHAPDELQLLAMKRRYMAGSERESPK
jgi:hypothetical protein